MVEDKTEKNFQKEQKEQKKKKQKVGKKNVKIDLGGPIMIDQNQSNNEKGKKGREDIFKQKNKNVLEPKDIILQISVAQQVSNTYIQKRPIPKLIIM